MSLPALVAVLVAVSAGASAPPVTVVASADASAFAVQVVTPDEKIAAGDVSAPPAATSPRMAYAYPADGSTVSAVSVNSAATALFSTGATSKASAEVTGLSLFGGEI